MKQITPSLHHKPHFLENHVTNSIKKAFEIDFARQWQTKIRKFYLPSLIKYSFLTISRKALSACCFSSPLLSSCFCLLTTSGKESTSGLLITAGRFAVRVCWFLGSFAGDVFSLLSKAVSARSIPIRSSSIIWVTVGDTGLIPLAFGLMKRLTSTQNVSFDFTNGSTFFETAFAVKSKSPVLKTKGSFLPRNRILKMNYTVNQVSLATLVLSRSHDSGVPGNFGPLSFCPFPQETKFPTKYGSLFGNLAQFKTEQIWMRFIKRKSLINMPCQTLWTIQWNNTGITIYQWKDDKSISYILYAF